jgi:DNA invertase Pin-like site-specific DNA recombinase
VSYFRVRTARQGRSGPGLDAQREVVTAYLNVGNWTVLADFVEVESGRKSDRPELAKAVDLCRLTGSTLVIAKLDRLARDAHFLLGLQKVEVEFVACDMPQANRLTIGITALVAEEEARAISAQTRAELAAAKARETKLGGCRGGPVVDDTLAADAVRESADALTAGVAPMLR